MNSKNTIVECVFDINFESNSVTETFLTVIAGVDGFEELLKLPIHQIPEQIRKSDPNLKNQPLYEIHSNSVKGYKILLGDNVIGIAIDKEYTSWTNSFFPQIKKLFDVILNSGKIKQINRMGLRYVDFFESDNIFSSGKIKIDIDKKEISNKRMFLRIEDIVNNIAYHKIITNETEYNSTGSVGSIVDIVTFLDNENFTINQMFDKESFFQKIDSLHTVNKEKFKEVISNELIEKLGL